MGVLGPPRIEYQVVLERFGGIDCNDPPIGPIVIIHDNVLVSAIKMKEAVTVVGRHRGPASMPRQVPRAIWQLRDTHFRPGEAGRCTRAVARHLEPRYDLLVDGCLVPHQFMDLRMIKLIPPDGVGARSITCAN